jgi:hypothetical protein
MKYKIQATDSMGFKVFRIQDAEGLTRELYIGEFSNFGLAKDYVDLKGGSYELFNQWNERK